MLFSRRFSRWRLWNFLRRRLRVGRHVHTHVEIGDRRDRPGQIPLAFADDVRMIAARVAYAAYLEAYGTDMVEQAFAGPDAEEGETEWMPFEDPETSVVAFARALAEAARRRVDARPVDAVHRGILLSVGQLGSVHLELPTRDGVVFGGALGAAEARWEVVDREPRSFWLGGSGWKVGGIYLEGSACPGDCGDGAALRRAFRDERRLRERTRAARGVGARR